MKHCVTAQVMSELSDTVLKLTHSYCEQSGFGGLVVSMLASGTRVRCFEPGRSRWIFRVSE